MALFPAIIGARSTWEGIGTERAHRRHITYRDTRYNEFARARDHLIVRHVTYDAAGSNSGGGGDGLSEATTYKVRHMADFKTLLAASIIAGLGLVIPRDVVIPASFANTDQSLQFTAANVSIGTSTPGTRYPEITSFLPAGTATSVASNTSQYDFAANFRVYGVRGRLAGSGSRDDYRLVPYKQMASSAAVDGTPYSFYSHPTSGSQYVNHGAHDPALCEFSVTTASGIVVQNFNGCTIDEMNVDGFAMHLPGFAAAGNINVLVQDANIFLCRETNCHWGSYHCTLHTGGTTAGNGGGVVTWHNCQWGYWQYSTSGGFSAGDGNVSYSYEGGNECGRYNCRTPYGGLDFEGITLTHQTPYCHTFGGGGRIVSYLAEIDCNWVVSVGVGITNDTMCGNPIVFTPGVSNCDSQESYCVYSCNRTSSVKSESPGGMIGVHDRMRQTITPVVPGGSFIEPFSAGASSAPYCIKLNYELVINFVGSFAGKNLRLHNIAGTDANFRWIHFRLRFTGTSSNSIAAEWSDSLKLCSHHNGVVSVENGVASGSIDWTTNPYSNNHFRESDPGSGAGANGGIIGLAHWNMRATHVDNTTGQIALGAAPTWQAGADVVASCRNSSYALPTGLDCWQDLLGNRRNPDHTKRSRGPIEANPWRNLPPAHLMQGIPIAV